ncbi:winged helix-turn-helix transcriptional regulator [Photobacterium sp. TY1-4]|uniref:winged helix-turn-helix transcriptional regulator n=1 Tax=Photobacterium sp. TY1-4 TaxID=2899122 RepID=UPI0021C1ACFE|nr:helix-turn-helix domain-containing protein [Photobacterium sp. TY1-4]UXI03171.1 helix-turn-helix transcriptional regulator [Photobacterium sp. TY1-4]
MAASNQTGKRVFVQSADCPIRDVVAQIGDKWSILILFSLVDGPDRFNSLKSRIEGISQRMLTQTLRDLERDGFVNRTVYSEVPVKVEYELTELGKGLTKSVWGLVSWADAHHDDIRAARQHYDAKKQ